MQEEDSSFLMMSTDYFPNAYTPLSTFDCSPLCICCRCQNSRHAPHGKRSESCTLWAVKENHIGFAEEADVSYCIIQTQNHITMDPWSSFSVDFRDLLSTNALWSFGHLLQLHFVMVSSAQALGDGVGKRGEI